MTKAEVREFLRQLPLDEQLELAEEVWDDAAPPTDFKLTPELRDLLARRRAEFLANPEAGASWNEVKARILRGL